ncbi:MAG: hypothetical protein EAZ24_02425 [Burkholderiales bacterium]|nr:MAG: hypothetical protein EAZ21_04825 [Betaproteobacteria bacterium]TAG83935.1 MAG: hypothetical protein EAZ24_02425 [Burkholderiales bacterium]
MLQIRAAPVVGGRRQNRYAPDYEVADLSQAPADCKYAQPRSSLSASHYAKISDTRPATV